MEKEIKLSAKLYQQRDTAKALFEKKYHDKIKPYIHIVKETMKSNNMNEFEALILISKTNVFNTSSISKLLFFSAIVEIIEPRNTLNHD